MDKLQGQILNRLLDKYEASKSFTGENKVNQNFAEQVAKIFPRYQDDAEYDYFYEVNEALRELENHGLVQVEWLKNGVAVKVKLRLEKKEECYRLVRRRPKQEELYEVEDVLKKHLCGSPSIIMQAYGEEQMRRMRKNKSVEYYSGDIKEFDDLLNCVEHIFNNMEEIYIRDFSIQLFGDSKRVECLKAKAEGLLYQYGEFEEKTSVCEECGIVSTPTYVCMKGNARLLLAGQTIDLSQLAGDLALSTASLKELCQVTVIGDRVVTVENLTSFHDYREREDFVVYLGGFHNQVKCRFLQFVYEQNPQKQYCHFGDIDAGGFYILEHLKRKTGILFIPMYMDISVLKRYQRMTKKLSGNDRKRLQQILAYYETGGEEDSRIAETIMYMLEQDCKLEQEAVRFQ